MANVLGVKTNIGIRLIIALIVIIYGPGNWVKHSGKVLEKFWIKSLEKMCGNPGIKTPIVCDCFCSETAQSAVGSEVKEAVITVPFEFDQAQKNALR